MTREEFIEALKIQTSDAAVFGTMANLKRPPGRKPREQDVMLSKWYAGLADLDKERVEAVVREAAELAVFSFLGILDGISAIENGPVKGELRLSYFKGDAEQLLNDPSQEFLHDSYNVLCHMTRPLPPERQDGRVYEVGEIQQLRSNQTANDGLDLHSIPSDKEHRSSETAAMALPKNEHRKL